MVLAYLPTLAQTKSPSHVGRYTSTMESMGPMGKESSKNCPEHGLHLDAAAEVIEIGFHVATPIRPAAD